MLRRKYTLAIALAAGLATAVFFQKLHSVKAQTTDLPNTGLADPSTFIQLYNNWKTARMASDTNTISIPLLVFGGLSSEGPNASGAVTVNTVKGTLYSEISGLPLIPGLWELWLVDNRGGKSTLADNGDGLIRVGFYVPGPQVLSIQATLDAAKLKGFEVDRAVVVRVFRNPASGLFVLTGSASVYERLFQGMVRVDTPDGGTRPVQSDSDIWDLAAKGRKLFKSETFGGNGRTCGTCHAETNNFTLDANYIATLPASDPLFVHEQVADLKTLENAKMLRQLGLILGNPDGGDDLAHKYVLRPPRSLQAIGTQIAAPEAVFASDFTNVGPLAHLPERLGWGNDNLPLRDFAVGAISQHMTKSLRRRVGFDYRAPTDAELDAMAIYQLSIGRAEDFDLKTLKLNVQQAIAGQKLYIDTGNIAEPGHKNCNACHFNAGGTVAFALNPGAPGFSPKLDANWHGENGAMGTNVNGLPQSGALNIPRDGGFGKIPNPFGGFGNIAVIPDCCQFPVEEFKSMSVVESADTAPFFHNHAVATLEEAVAFYGSEAYKDDDLSIGGTNGGPVPVRISIDSADKEVQAISTFLRVLNTLENLRSAISALERARRAPSASDESELVSLATGEIKDAIKVMSTGSLDLPFPEFILQLSKARLILSRTTLESLKSATSRDAMEPKVVDVLSLLRSARDLLVADRKTLPASFQK